MIKKNKAQNYQIEVVLTCPILFKDHKDFIDSVIFNRHFSQRLIGDVNG